MLRLMIVDDEVAMRLALKKAIEKLEDIKLVGEGANGEEAISIMLSEPVDVAFLDVDMPGINGVETAKELLDINPKCAIVFITAHESYMKEAFELYAFDYIVKPFKVERLYKTIERLTNQTSAIQGISRKTKKDHLIAWEDEEKISHEDENLLLKVKDGMIVIKKDDIVMIERINRQTIITTTDGAYNVTKTLKEMEGLLGDKHFLRSHKSYIIKIEAVKSLEVYGRWTYVVKLNGTENDALITKEKVDMLSKKFHTMT